MEEMEREQGGILCMVTLVCSCIRVPYLYYYIFPFLFKDYIHCPLAWIETVQQPVACLQVSLQVLNRDPDYPSTIHGVRNCLEGLKE